jgi:two-component system sensor histidine kinase MprB
LTRIPLRARLALLVAASVAVAIAVCAAASWFLVRDQLLKQVDLSLQTGIPHSSELQEHPDRLCRGSDDAPQGRMLLVIDVVHSDGSTCSAAQSPVVLTPADSQIAAGGDPRNQLRNGRLEDGTEVRVLTTAYGDDSALVIGRPVQETRTSLGNLELLLAIVAAIGVVGAATVGLLVSRAALRPVHELTAAAEHVARTEDLDTQIPVSGHDEIARLSRSFNTMTGALAASRERQSRLIADASHELRTPLTSLRTNIDLMLRSEETGRPLPAADKRRLLQNLRAQMRELSSLVGDLLALARQPMAGATAAHGMAPLPGTTAKPAAIDVREVVERAVERARLRGPDRQFMVSLEPWRCRADPDTLERAVVNLLDNAVKFSPQGSPVAIRLADGVLAVRDWGIGVPPDEVQYVFDRFWRSPSARSMPGSGLGLAIVAQAAADAGGSVELIPAEGGGTIVLLRLPAAEAAVS